MSDIIEYKPGTPFPGVIGRTLDESSPAWPEPTRPVTLPGNSPVAESEGSHTLAKAICLGKGGYGNFGLLRT